MENFNQIDMECSALAGLFQRILIDLKNSGPMWEDFLSKSTKLQQTLKMTLVAFSTFLDAFQRIADSATNARGATKEVGAALTRLSLRHRAIETKIKSLTCSFSDSLVVPLQEKCDEWKRINIAIDKEHTKEYKRSRTDIKKRTESTVRLHKKIKKSSKNPELVKVAESSMNDLMNRFNKMKCMEQTAVRNALIEERARFCVFSSALKPVLVEEVGLVSELGHLQEVMVQLEKHSAQPRYLPPASERVLEDIKGGDSKWTWQTPPSSPTSSLGSRKSSLCSISSINSSSSSSAHSPAHHQRPLSTSQGQRLVSVCSQDSGFTSQDTLHNHLLHRHSSALFMQASVNSDRSVGSENSHTSNVSPQGNSTWPNLNDTSLQHKSASTSGLHTLVDRPHTISSAYERGRERPPLTVYTFQPPDGSCGQTSPQISSQPVSPVCLETDGVIHPLAGQTATISRRSSRTSLQQMLLSSSQESINGSMNKPRPPLPSRCSSLERPVKPEKTFLKPKPKSNSRTNSLKKKKIGNITPEEPLSMPDFNKAAPDMVLPHPVYSNMDEINASRKYNGLDNNHAGREDLNSLSSSGYGSQPNMSIEQGWRSDVEGGWNSTMRPHSLAVVPQSLSYSQYSFQGPSSPRCGSLRRGQKPPPPIRRTSSITSTCSQPKSTQSTPSSSSPMSLRESILSFSKSTSRSSSSPNTFSSLASSPAQNSESGSITPTAFYTEENFPPPPAFLLEDSQTFCDHEDLDGKTPEAVENFEPIERKKFVEDECLKKRSLSVSEAVKTLQDIQHTPRSPQTQRKLSLPKNLPSSMPVTVPAKDERHPSYFEAKSLISSMQSRVSQSPPQIQRCAPRTLSPKLPKMRLTSVLEGVAIEAQQSIENTNKPKPASVKPEVRPHLKPGQKNFMANLNMVLLQRAPESPNNSNPNSPKLKTKRKQQVSPGLQRSSSTASEKAAKVRQWIVSKTVKSNEIPAQSLRDSLMDQIRRGTALRKAKYTADRSAPRVR